MLRPFKDVTAAASIEPNTDTGLNRSTLTRIVQNFRLICLDANIDDVNDNDWRDNISRLRRSITTIDTFADADQCVQFLTNIKDEMVFLIVTGYVGQRVVPIIHNMPQLHSIYILCGNASRHQQWVKQWLKIKGVFTEISSICNALKPATRQCDQDCISIGFMSASENPSTQNLDQLDPSFMYTQILKEILLTIDFHKSHIQEFIDYCRENIPRDAVGISIIDELEQNYLEHTSIWWYTYESFLYSMLNRALRQMDVDIIIKMGFYVRDLHCQIARLHQEQFDNHQELEPFTVYRGQGLSINDFDHMLKMKRGLISFNNFLSTSKDKHVSLEFAKQARTKPNMVGVLFVITIDPTISSTPFASIKEFSYLPDENEILFSMHAIFRIVDIGQMEADNRLWQVTLTVTSDNDQKRLALTERMREETRGYTGFIQLAMLLNKVARFDKAQQLLELLLTQTSDLREESHICHLLGWALKSQGQYTKALSFYEKDVEITKASLPENHPDLATSYSNIGQVYSNMGEYSKALSFYEKGLGIRKEALPENHPALAISYCNIGGVYSDMGEYSKALFFYEKDVEITKASLPENHPDLAASYTKIGQVYSNMGEYSKALSFYKKALGIQKEALPENHPYLANSYSNIGQVYSNMGEYSKALFFYEKDVEITKASLPENHPDLATSYSKIGQVYSKMGEYSKALSCYEKALGIQKEALPENHPDLATSYSNIGGVYSNMGEYSKALSFYEKDVEITKASLPENHPDLATSYSNIGQVYSNMGEYSKALSFYEKGLGIRKEALSENHPYLATSYRYIGQVYNNLGEYSKALLYQEKARDIYETSLSANHPALANVYSDLGQAFDNMGEHAKALASHEKALGIRLETLSADHPHVAVSYSNIGEVYFNIGEYPKALSSHEKSLKIREKSLGSMHPDMAICYNNIGLVYSKIDKYSEALSMYEKAIDIRQRILPPNHPYLATSYDNMGKVYEYMGEYSKALLFYQRAADTGQCSLPESHPHLQLYRDHVQVTKSKL